jgi:hypothetical protein
MLLVFFFSLNLAPMMFESFTSDRIWASNPPDSFYMFLGRYGQNTAGYWRIVSPLASVAFVVSFIFNWDASGRALWLVVAFALFLVIQIATMAYLVPEQESLIAHARSLSRDVLETRARRWRVLNYFRNVAGVVAFVCLLTAVLAPAVP